MCLAHTHHTIKPAAAFDTEQDQIPVHDAKTAILEGPGCPALVSLGELQLCCPVL